MVEKTKKRRIRLILLDKIVYNKKTTTLFYFFIVICADVKWSKKGGFMNSKERVKTAFEHREPDRVPISELYINSPVASKVLGRTAYTGWSGYIQCFLKNNMLMQGRGKEYYLQEAIDLVDL